MGKKKTTWTIVSYPEIRSEEGKHVWHADTKRQVVGLMKTIMDNFNPKHVDICRDDKNKGG